MRFGKQFETQQVLEWKDVYCDYRHLKQLIHNIEQHRKQERHRKASSSSPKAHLSKSMSNFRRLVSGLHIHGLHSPKSPSAIEEEMILIEPREQEDGIKFQTAFLGISSHDELDRVFFRDLDTELAKVNKFYQSREKELVNQAAALDAQMEALITARHESKFGSSRGENGNVAVEPLEVVGGTSMGTLDRVDEEGSVKPVKINISPATPSEAFASLFSDLASKSLMNMNTRKVKKAEEILQQAFVEYYKGLCLLRNYSSLNIIAFSKALKKYDKVTLRNLSRKYLKAVESSYIGRSDKVQKLMDKVEVLFTKYFADAHRQKAMQLLRPEVKRERHRITFFLGLFAGCTLALLVAIVLTIRLDRLYAAGYATQYMNAVFPIFSMLAAVLLHLYLYGLNIYLWRRTGINHSFILGLKRGKELRFRDVFLLATGLSTLALIGMTWHLQATAGEICCVTRKESIPLIVVAGMFLWLLLPFNILYRSTRFFFLRTLWHCLLTPFYKVIITDFLLADQLTSQVQALKDFEYVLCYYGGGFFKDRNSKACLKNHTFITFGFVVSLLPYWCRIMQCLRRWYSEKDKMQFYNALKYFSAILAVASRTAYSYRRGSTLLLVTTAILSAVATIFSTYWDIVYDWGLLCRKSENPWLRDKLAIRYVAVYYFAMVSNVILRLAWLQSLIDVHIPGINPKGLILMVACLEVIRRGQWNYYRIENEHFNNVGNYRAVKSLLPFNIAYFIAQLGFFLLFGIACLTPFYKVVESIRDLTLLDIHHLESITGCSMGIRAWLRRGNYLMNGCKSRLVVD